MSDKEQQKIDALYQIAREIDKCRDVIGLELERMRGVLADIRDNLEGINQAMPNPVEPDE